MAAARRRADAENLLHAARRAEYIGEPEDINEAERVAWIPLDTVRDRIAKGEIVEQRYASAHASWASSTAAYACSATRPDRFAVRRPHPMRSTPIRHDLRKCREKASRSPGNLVPMSPEHVIVSTTTAAEKDARDIAASAISAKLGACAQVIGPITSVYRWEGAVQTDTEWRVEFKTAADRVTALTEHIKANHGYDVPEIIATPIVGGSTEYLAWLIDETRGEGT